MTNTEIKNIINEENTNKDIKWSILENTKTKITLTNNYDKSINYSIEVRNEEHTNEEWIEVINNHMGSTVAGLLQGDSKWDDYKDTEEGMRKGIAIAVHNFNRMY